MTDFIPQFTGHVNTDPCRDWRYTCLKKGSQGCDGNTIAGCTVMVVPLPVTMLANHGWRAWQILPIEWATTAHHPRFANSCLSTNTTSAYPTKPDVLYIHYPSGVTKFFDLAIMISTGPPGKEALPWIHNATTQWRHNDIHAIKSFKLSIFYFEMIEILRNLLLNEKIITVSHIGLNIISRCLNDDSVWGLVNGKPHKQ